MNKIILKLIPPPQAARSMMAIFRSIKAASETVSAIIAGKILPATLEMMDNFTIKTVENFRQAGLPTDAAALLLIEVDGHPAQVADDAEKVEKICKECGAVRCVLQKTILNAPLSGRLEETPYLRLQICGPPVCLKMLPFLAQRYAQ